jgi:hypothetical protein
LLRIVVEAEAHSTMSHDLGNVGLVLTTKTLLLITQGLTCFGKRTGNESIKPFLVAVQHVKGSQFKLRLFEC